MALLFLLFQMQVKACDARGKPSTGCHQTATGERQVQQSLLSAVISAAPSSLDAPHGRQNCSAPDVHDGSRKVHMLSSHGEEQQALCPESESSRPHGGSNHGDKRGKEKRSGDKRHACDVCHMAFTHAGNLQKHKWVHTGHRPFVCECAIRLLPALVT